MTTSLNFKAVPANDKLPKGILCMDNKGEPTCTIWCDGGVTFHNSIDIFVPELEQINTVQQHFDMFYKILEKYNDLLEAARGVVQSCTDKNCGEIEQKRRFVSGVDDKGEDIIKEKWDFCVAMCDMEHMANLRTQINKQ